MPIAVISGILAASCDEGKAMPALWNALETSATRRKIGIVFASGIACFTPVNAAGSPRQIVDVLYAPYLRDPHAASPDIPDPLGLIGAFASDGLGKAIKRNLECEQREEGICNIDFDILICGQDWDISHFRLTVSGDKSPKPVVRANFDNMGRPETVSFMFIREGGKWAIDDVIATCTDEESAQPSSPFPLKQSLLKD